MCQMGGCASVVCRVHNQVSIFWGGLQGVSGVVHMAKRCEFINETKDTRASTDNYSYALPFLVDPAPGCGRQTAPAPTRGNLPSGPESSVLLVMGHGIWTPSCRVSSV